MRNINAILAIAWRDFSKLTRDKGRLVFSFIFPFVFIGLLGGSLQSNLADGAGYNFLTFVFSGVLGQTLFQSTASGIISLIEDRKNDFSQEMFISPVSRYAIILGKILGETMVALVQLIAILAYGFIIGVDLSFPLIIKLAPFFVIVCIMGGAFGLIVLAILDMLTTSKSQRTAEMAFPFVMFPQFFLAGVFSPIKILPLPLMIASRIAPMTYAVDLVRSVFYTDSPVYSKVVLFNTPINLAVVGTMTLIFTVVGTFLFIRNEHNR